MDDEPNSEGHYGRQVECTWVAHAFKNYGDLGQLVNFNSLISRRDSTHTSIQ